jgi:V-type H+-transporting ATPase subunit F
MASKLRYKDGEQRMIGVIGDEDTVTGFLLAGVGDKNGKNGANFFVVSKATSLGEIEDAFRTMAARDDISMILIVQHIANDIQHAIEAHTAALPCVLEIPSKSVAYDPAKDVVLAKLNRYLGE